jgi:cell pole-organizing protein PopZ
MKEDLSIDQIISSIRHVILGRKNDQFDDDKNRYLEDNDDIYELNLKHLVVKKNDAVALKNLATEDYLPSGKVAEDISKDTIESLRQEEGAKQKQSRTPVKLKNETIENVVIELIKPYLQHWIDENLSRIVKNLVEKEINGIMTDEKHSIDKFNSQ